MRSLRAVRAEGERIAESEARARAAEAMESVRQNVRRMPGVSLSGDAPAPSNDNTPAKTVAGFTPPMVVSPAAWHGKPIPEREWFLDGLVPMRQVTILSGDGGVGKSLLALQWAAAAATDRQTVGGKPQAGGVMYLGAEDEQDEFHRRLADIMKALGGTLANLDAFQLLPMAEMDALLSIPDRTGKMQPTPLWNWFSEQAKVYKPTLIVLDTVADLYGGDEIKRAQVRQFIAMLRRLAMARKCAVLLLAHPSVEGMKSGTGSSGSTGWRNSSRSQLYLTRPEGKDADTDLRELKTMKANYGKVGGSLQLRWERGAFELEDGTKPNAASNIMARKADEVFIELLSKFNKIGLSCSPAPSATYAPSMMEKDVGSQGIKKKAFTDAMRRLLEKGEIKIVEEGPASRTRKRLLVASEMFGNEVAA